MAKDISPASAPVRGDMELVNEDEKAISIYADWTPEEEKKAKRKCAVTALMNYGVV